MNLTKRTAAFPNVGIGLLGVALAFGLTVLTMAYAIGHISGCHLNPAVSFGLWAGGRFPASELLPYIAGQVLGGIDVSAGFAANGYAAHSPGQYSLLACLVAEVVLTMMFLWSLWELPTSARRRGLRPWPSASASRSSI